MNAERVKFFAALTTAGAAAVAALWGVFYALAYGIQFVWGLFVR